MKLLKMGLILLLAFLFAGAWFHAGMLYYAHTCFNAATSYNGMIIDTVAGIPVIACRHE